MAPIELVSWGSRADGERVSPVALTCFRSTPRSGLCPGALANIRLCARFGLVHRSNSQDTECLAHQPKQPLRDAGPIKLPCRSAITRSELYSATSKYSSPSNTNLACFTSDCQACSLMLYSMWSFRTPVFLAVFSSNSQVILWRVSVNRRISP